MGKACQSLECLDAIHSIARSGCVDLEPSVDRTLGIGSDGGDTCLDMDQSTDVFQTRVHG